MLKRTPLYEQHVANGAKMAPFAGYEMPLYYTTGALKEHQQVRQSAGLFDVSHMGQIFVSGSSAVSFWQQVTPSDFSNLANAKARYTVLTNSTGGIVDDLIVTKLSPEHFFAVLNAACVEKDIAHLQRYLPKDLILEVATDRALLAMQGPKAATVLSDVLQIETDDQHFMQCKEIDGLNISRVGYTGEDGFEISCSGSEGKELWEKLLKHPAVLPVGLAARDSLRLEMGYPLYGHDLDDTTSPIEANLRWLISEKNSTFLGCERCHKELKEGPKRLRVGIVLEDRQIAREGAKIYDQRGNAIGALTSGGYSPTLGRAIGQGYVQKEAAIIDARVFVAVREKQVAAKICAMPFVTRRTS